MLERLPELPSLPEIYENRRNATQQSSIGESGQHSLAQISWAALNDHALSSGLNIQVGGEFVPH